MSYKYSLIIATLGRKKDLIRVLESIKDCNYDIRLIEIIIVDQNEKGFLDQELSVFKDLNLKHIRSDIKGLSYNRNVGLKYATGDIISFPDDDCKYYQDTLSEVSKVLLDLNVDFCVGRLYDRELENDILKKWPKKGLKVNRFNSYFINSSINMFVKKQLILNFDEDLGVGSDYGSCEDADFIYRILKNNGKGTYSPKVEIWHPEPKYQEISLERVRNYASGFGFFVRKNADAIKIALLLLLVAKKIKQLTLNILTKKFKKGYFKFYFQGLIKGLFHK